MPELNKLKLEIINSLIMIPGIKGFVDQLSEDKVVKPLSEKFWYKAISIKTNENKYLIDLSILISFDIKTKYLCERIEQNIKYIIKKQKKALGYLNIYIKGVY